MTALFICPRQNIRSRDGNPATQAQRIGNEALSLAIDLTAFELRQRQSEWSRHGREDLAEAFRRIEQVVGGIE